MVVRADPECSWCYRNGILGVPAHPYWISIEGIGGLYDLCERDAEHILGPLALMRAEGLARANRTEELPEGWYGKAWPGATSSVPPPGGALPASGTVAGRPVRKAVTAKAAAKTMGKKGAKASGNGTRPRAGAESKLLCPFAPHLCDHPGIGTFAGVLDHMRRKHNRITVAQMLQNVTLCGLCAPPVEVASNQHLGVHARRVHGEALPPTLAHGSWGLALVTAVRRAGDPHGTLKAMDAYSLTLESGQSTNTQLALGESPASADQDPAKGDD